MKWKKHCWMSFYWFRNVLQVKNIKKTICFNRVPWVQSYFLEGGVYFDQSINGAALIGGWGIFEPRCLLDEIRYLLHFTSRRDTCKNKFSHFLSKFVVLSQGIQWMSFTWETLHLDKIFSNKWYEGVKNSLNFVKTWIFPLILGS